MAMATFVADQRWAEREQREQVTKAAEARRTHATAVFDLAEQQHPGFHDRLQAETRMYPGAVMELLAQEAAQDPHTSAELLHHLMTEPDDAARLSSCTSPIAAAKEIGRLTARLSSAPAGPETGLTHTTAKPLIKPVRPSVMAAEATAPEDLPFGPKYIAAMNERDRKAREARRA
jgi:hypothetical protein